MRNAFQSSRDVILRTSQWIQAREFYENGLGFKVTNETDTILRVETGAIRFFVENGEPHGPVFDFLVRDFARFAQQLHAMASIRDLARERLCERRLTGAVETLDRDQLAARHGGTVAPLRWLV